MDIQVNAHQHLDPADDLVERVELLIESTLGRFRTQLTRIEVHLGDENGEKATPADKRCTVEARPAGQKPVAVTHHAATLDEACRGATQKLKTLLESQFGRLHEHKGGDSIRRMAVDESGA